MKARIANLESIRFRPKRVGFVVKHQHREAAELAVELAKFVLSRGIPVAFAEESTSVVNALVSKATDKKDRNRISIVHSKLQLVANVDLIIVLGGDGTFLSIARLMRTRSVPVMGVNMGQLGFLTEIKRGEARETLARILQGRPMPSSSRALLEVSLRRDGKLIHRGPVVNDAVISKGAIARIIGLQIAVNGKWAHDVRADGIIVSTPTGSTAYSLAAGGPIIEPSLPSVIMTPICPHSLTQRPLVIPDSAEIRIQLTQRPGHVLLTLDGQDAVDMREGDTVVVRRFTKHSLKLISSPTRDYFSLLREKLRFGERE